MPLSFKILLVIYGICLFITFKNDPDAVKYYYYREIFKDL